MVVIMDEDRKASPFASMGTSAEGGAPDLTPRFPSTSLADQTGMFRSGSAGHNSGAPIRGRDRARSASPNYRPMAAKQSAGSQDAGKLFGNNSDPQREEEEAAKARRLVRFGAEFGSRAKPPRPASVPDDEEASPSIFMATGTTLEPGSRGVSGGQAKLRDTTQMVRIEAVVEPPVDMDTADDFTSEPILGICPDMCPEVERNERERKGDLDRFERVRGNRNQTARELAVKKYTRTAEKEAVLIRPLVVLQKTMGHLLSLLERDHDDDLLAVHSFLWDRMRAVRMDLRMQHIFTGEAINMHEQMIRFHILAMHELCEFSQGEGMSEVFNAHLNIEQMNKTSVDLFQMYEDHAKRGILVQSEAEFRGYYALLKLDKHPGYRVEPAELSLDLAKMTPDIRNSQQVRFARDVARACRASNYVAFFRLAREATYLQACLMHAHFSKLRTQALASLHSGLQKNQGIPLSTVVNWLGMEGEDIEALLKYHGFPMKYYEEAYMVKEGPFLSKNQDFPTCRAQFIESKRSSSIAMDVQAERRLDTMTQMQPGVKEIGGVVKSGLVERNGPPGSEEGPILVSLSPVVDTKEEEMPDYMEEPVEVEQENIELGRVAPIVEVVRVLAEEEGKQGKKRHMEELQFEAEEHERRRLRHEADAITRRDASQAAAAEIRRAEEQLRRAGHRAEAKAGKQGLWFRKWRRRAAASALERHRKLLESEAALDTLSLGHPLWKMRVLGDSVSLTQRDEYTEALVEEQGLALQHMWKPLDIPSLVGPILQGLNPAACFLYWKLLLSTPSSFSGQWVRAKVGNRPKLGTGQDFADQGWSPITLAEDSILLSGNQGNSAVEFRYSVEELGIDAILHVEVPLRGPGGLLFVINENETVSDEHTRLRALVQNLPEGANVPLLVLSTNSWSEKLKAKEQGDWEQLLTLSELSSSKISSYKLVSVVQTSGTNLGTKGYFSHETLMEGIIWLARLCPVQPRLRSMQVPDLIKEHVDTLLALLLRLPHVAVNPEHCIQLFNQGLQNAAQEIVGTASNLATSLPVSDLTSAQKFRDGGQEVIRPGQGWNSKEILKVIVADLNFCCLPPFPASHPSGSTESIRLQKLRLEQSLLEFLALIEGRDLDDLAIKWEVSWMVQRGCTVEWSDSGRKLVPNWAQIFQAIFAAQLMLLSLKPWPLVYIARMGKIPPVQLGRFEIDKCTSKILTSPDFSCDRLLLLDDMIGLELQRHPSADRENSSSFEGIRSPVTGLLLAPPMEVDGVPHLIEDEMPLRSESLAASGTISRALNKSGVLAFQRYMGCRLPEDGAVEWLLNRDQDNNSKRLQLGLTQSERSLDKMLAELKQQERGSTRSPYVTKVDPLHVSLPLSYVTKVQLEPEQKFCEDSAEEGAGYKHSEEVPYSFQEANHVSEEKFLLTSSPYEPLLDKLVAASRRWGEKGLEQYLVDIVKS